MQFKFERAFRKIFPMDTRDFDDGSQRFLPIHPWNMTQGDAQNFYLRVIAGGGFQSVCYFLLIK